MISNFKTPKIIDPDHLRFIGKLPCVVTGSPYTVPHHILRGHTEKGMATKAGDDKTIPLHNDIHLALHRTGNETEYLKQFHVTNALEVAAALYHYQSIEEATQFIKDRFARHWTLNRRKVEELLRRYR